MKVKGCRKTRDSRDVLEAILWKLRTGAPWRDVRAIGISRGGPTTKIHVVTDAHGNPISFEVTGGKFTTQQLP